MSLSFSSPSPGTKRRFPLPNTNPSANDTTADNCRIKCNDKDNRRKWNNPKNEDIEDNKHPNNYNETPFSPLGNPTLLGQLNPHIESSSNDQNGRDASLDPLHYPQQHIELPPGELPEAEGIPHHLMSEGSGEMIQNRHLFVLPVLLLEFLAIALTRAVLPSILIEEYGSNVYVVLGVADCIRGILAFFACPMFGKLSDVLGRKICLFVTVLGSCAPICSLAFFNWDSEERTAAAAEDLLNETVSTIVAPDTSTAISSALPPMAIPLFVVLLSLSGIFSSTFPLVFAYISDSVQERNERVTAYGLALATFGLSFTIGPMAGGYLANSKTDYVFRCSLGLTILDLLYIYVILPESTAPRIVMFSSNRDATATTASRSSDASSFKSASRATRKMLLEVADSISWNPWDSIWLVLHDPFLRKVGQVAFFYYTGLWAVISTLSLYAVQHFKMTPQMLGELMSALGLSTMVAEAVLVRFMVPLVGEKRAIRIGLVSFGLQCFVLGAANQSWQLFFCVGLSLLGNLVYPSLSSLVSGIVEPKTVGEALGAINGIKALTEGLGPLIFGTLMTFSEHTAFPGSPYWLAGILVFVAHHLADKLPANSESELALSSFSYPDEPSMISPPEKEYIHELEFKRRYPRSGSTRKRHHASAEDNDDCLSAMFPTQSRDDDDEEYQGLLSEIDEDSDDKELEEVHVIPSTAVIDETEQEVHSFAIKPV